MMGRIVQTGAHWPFAAQSTASSRPIVSVFVATGAGVAAIAQPLGSPYRPADPPLQEAPAPLPKAPPPVVRAATIRVVLPPPAPLTPARKREPTGILRIELPPPVIADEAQSAALVGHVDPVPLSPVAPGLIVPEPTVAPADTQDLAAARVESPASFSGAPHEIAEGPQRQPISMVGDEDWAELTRPYDRSAAPVSATDRSAALQPPKTDPKPLSGAVPITLDTDAAASATRLAVVDSPAKQRETGNVSFEVAAKINGADAGRLPLLIRDGANISVRLADLLTLLKPKIDPGTYDRLSGAQAAQDYITFNELRASGIAVRFDDRDRLLIGLR